MNKKIITCASIITLLLSGNFAATAQNKNETQWWFNVELIVFKRTLAPSNTESFGTAINLNEDDVNTNTKYPLGNNFLFYMASQDEISYRHHINALPLCDSIHKLDTNFDDGLSKSSTLNMPVNLPLTLENAYSNGSAFFLAKRLDQINTQLSDISTATLSLKCIDKNLPTPLTQFTLPNIGPRLFSDNSYFRGRKQLLAQSDLVLEDFAKNVFQQRDITPLLYTAWRQEVEFGIENAEFFRVRAGELLKTQTNSINKKQNITPNQNSTAFIQGDNSLFFETLRNNIENNEPVDWLLQETAVQHQHTDFIQATQYEMDGKIKVFLDYVNQIPYLHLDIAFNHFSLTVDENGNTELNTFPSKQRRRVISKQIHYFDHPAFGVIVRLERFNPPETQQQKIAVDDSVTDR